ncbi:MAG TPA: hypothetical protein VK550_27605 [Polyangiaceae bacterium]|nr:hypothetical protein [Polyangiaceae bacterium]
MTARNALAALGLATLVSCAGAVESSKLEDGARRTVPVPICLKPLPRHGASGIMATLKPEDYWSTLLPSFDPSAGTVDRTSADCSGRQLLGGPELLQVEGPRTGPVKVAEGDATVTPGPDGFKIVWLRTHRLTGGDAAGLLALMRAKEAYAEVYAVGMHRGNPARARFAFERLGPEILVTATDEGCTGVKANQPCETMLTTYLMRSGELVPGARFAIDRIAYGPAAGVSGNAQYRLTAAPVFQERSIRVVEQIVVRDSAQGEIRKSDLERTFTLANRSSFVASTESLWGQVIGGGKPAANGGAANPPPPPPPPAPPR